MTAPLSAASLDQLVGQELGTSRWVRMEQGRIGAFAECTGDHQWIHVDAARAAAESPFKTTIAHGFLTLSLISTLMRDAIRIGGLRMAINYGLNRVRFMSPVPSGARVRGRFTAAEVEETGGAIQVTWQITVERESAEKPCLIAQWIVRYYRA